VDKLDISRAEAIALCNGIIVSTLLNSNGNLTTKQKLHKPNENIFCYSNFYYLFFFSGTKQQVRKKD
jgi:hypothetical protein